jgi:hypothetical protein
MRKLLIAAVIASAAITAGCGGGDRIDPVHPASPGTSSHSPAYQYGYEFGNQHLGTGQHIAGNRVECQVEATQEGVPRRDETDWMAGCMDGVRDAQASATIPGKPGVPTVDCSKPENTYNGDCF